MAKNSEESTREGGREGAERPLPPDFLASKARNSSGSASLAASVLDLRQRVNFLLDMVAALAGQLGDAELETAIRRYRQEGFRRAPR